MGPDDSRTTRDNRVLAAVFVFGSLLLMIVLAIGIGVVRAIAVSAGPSATSPAPQPDLLVAGPIVRGGEALTLYGADWPPDQVVAVFLSDPARPGERQAVFSGQANAQGELILTLTYPADPRWTTLPNVDIIVQTSDQRFEVVRRVPVAGAAATPTPTLAVSATPTPTSTPTPTATPPIITDWKGEYFDNPSLSGAPRVVRNDAQINFNWGDGSPDAALPADRFSARWTRAIEFPAGFQRFTVKADDGVRLFIDDLPLIDEWHTYAGQTYSREVNLGAGVHNLRVEMYEDAGLAYISFSFERPITITEWKGEYFANRNLGGDPALVRNDPSINFEWGNGSPDPKLPPDGFSARWTRSLDFPAGVTRFSVRADDGVRVSIDGVRVIDEWHDASPTAYASDVNLAAGRHTVVVEYYENIGGASVRFSLQPASFTAWKGEYFSNRDLSGEPALVRDDANLDFNWGDGAPASDLPADNFSARWTRTLNFEAGTYLFSLIADDGARLFLDGAKMLDEWHDGTATYSFTVDLPAGSHAIVVEYYERTGKARAGLSWVRLPNTSTPSATPSPSPTPTISPTPSPTPTPTATASPTLSQPLGSP